MSIGLALPRELTIYTVGELRPLWLDRLAVADSDPVDPWSVDAAAVEEVDAAGLQLLLSLSNRLARERRQLRLADASPVLEVACRALALSNLLAQPPVDPLSRQSRQATARSNLADGGARDVQ